MTQGAVFSFPLPEGRGSVNGGEAATSQTWKCAKAVRKADQNEPLTIARVFFERRLLAQAALSIVRGRVRSQDVVEALAIVGGHRRESLQAHES